MSCGDCVCVCVVRHCLLCVVCVSGVVCVLLITISLIMVVLVVVLRVFRCGARVCCVIGSVSLSVCLCVVCVLLWLLWRLLLWCLLMVVMWLVWVGVCCSWLLFVVCGVSCGNVDVVVVVSDRTSSMIE